MLGVTITDMSFFSKILGNTHKLVKMRQEEKVENLPESKFIEYTDFLKIKIDQEHLCAKKNCRENKKAALQALRRKKLLEECLSRVDCIEVPKSAPGLIERLNQVNDLIMELIEKEDMSDNFTSSVDMVFDEDELLAELERLEQSLDESSCEDRLHLSPLLSLNSDPAERDEDEDDLEYLRRWVE